MSACRLEDQESGLINSKAATIQAVGVTGSVVPASDHALHEFAFFVRLDEPLARDAHPHDRRAGDRDREVDDKQDTDGQRRRELAPGEIAGSGAY